MTLYNAELPLDKAARLYVMLDRKSEDFALAKGGMTCDTLKHRFHSYRTSNPMLQLVAICEVRRNQNVNEVEEMIFNYLREEKGYDHVFGEWVAITNKEDIDAIEREGFRFFGNLFYRTKNNMFFNTPVYKLWDCRQR